MWGPQDINKEESVGQMVTEVYEVGVSDEYLVEIYRTNDKFVTPY